MAIVPQDLQDEQCRSKSILRFSQSFKMGRILNESNITKAKGVGVLTVFVQLLMMVFSGKPLLQHLKGNGLAGKKDVFYRFMNSTSANWMKFIRLTAGKLIALVMDLFEGSGVLILDDTLYKRNRSKEVELLTRVRDHNDGKYYRGFRCLTLCFHLKNAAIPVDFRLLSSQDAKTRLCERRTDLDKRSNGHKLREYATSSGYDMALHMLKKQRGLVRHVLFDSWFAQPVMFRSLRELGFHGVGMLKVNNNLYWYKGKPYKLDVLFSMVKPLLRKETDRVSLGVTLQDGTPFSITFVLDKRNNRDWLAIGTTDLSLSPEEVLILYGRRWNIEVFFKTVKSFLGFAKESQSRSLDAIVCSIAVVFTRHMILSWINFGLPKPESHGQLFFRLFDEMNDCSVFDAIRIVCQELFPRVQHIDDLLNLSLRDFFAYIPSAFCFPAVIPLCET